MSAMTDTRPDTGRAVDDEQDLFVLLTAVETVARRHGRGDLADSLRRLRSGLERSARLIAVVGEFKAGKSEFVNAILGESICPVDDDLASVTVTAVGHHPERKARVRRVVDGTTVTEAIEVEEVARLASERGNPGNAYGVEVIEVGLPNPVLEAGIGLIDTPGTGGLSGSTAMGLLRFLRSIDVVLFATDAARELTRSELELLGRIVDVCPAVAVVVTKIDLHAEWRRIADLDRGHLERAGLAIPVFGVSSTLALLDAEDLGGRSGIESGFADLLEALDNRLLPRAAASVTARVGRAVASAVSQLRQVVDAEVAALDDGGEDQLAGAEERLRALREAPAPLRRTLQHGVAEIRETATVALDEAFEATLRSATERLLETDPRQVWDEHIAELQADVAAAVEKVFDRLESSFAELAGQLAAQLQDEALPDFVPELELDVLALWSSQPRELQQATAASRVETGLTVLRGSYGGVLMLGMLGTVGVAIAPPFAIGTGALFGAQTITSMRKRAVQQRRQEAQQVATEFVRQTRRIAGQQLNAAVRAGQTTLEDHLQARLEQLTATYEAVRQRTQRKGAGQGESREQLERDRSELDGLLEEADRLLAHGSCPRVGASL